MRFKRLLFSGCAMLVTVFLFQLIRMDLIGIRHYQNSGAITFTQGTAEIPLNPEQDRYLLLYDSRDAGSMALKQNYEALFAFYQMGCTITDINAVSAPVLGVETRTILNCVADLEKIENLDTLIGIADGGGNFVQGLFPKVNGAYYANMSFFGINEVGDYFGREGLDFSEDYLFVSSNHTFSYPAEHNFAHSVTLQKDDCTVLIRAGDGTPLLWELQKGEGNLYFFNTTSLLRRESRGILTGMIGKLEPDFIYPVSNTFTMMLDGYAVPVTPQVSQYISKEYQTSYRYFNNNILKQPLQKMHTKYGLAYTASFINAFNSNTEAPFKNNGITRNDLISAMVPVLENGGEMAISGYNYKPLGLKGEFEEEGLFTSFPSIDDIRGSLNSTIDFAQGAFSSYQVNTYIPPGGQVSQTALDTLSRETAITVVAGVYDKYWKNELQQEFGLMDGIYHYPKITRLDQTGSAPEFSIYSSIQSFGAVSADLNLVEMLLNETGDVRTILKQFEEILDNVQKDCPYLSYLTVSQAAGRLNQIQSSKITREISEEGISVHLEGNNGTMQFLFKTQHMVRAAEGCSYEKISDNVYLVKSEQKEFKLLF